MAWSCRRGTTETTGLTVTEPTGPLMTDRLGSVVYDEIPMIIIGLSLADGKLVVTCRSAGCITATVRPGAASTVFDPDGNVVVSVRSTKNGKWTGGTSDLISVIDGTLTMMLPFVVSQREGQYQEEGSVR